MLDFSVITIFCDCFGGCGGVLESPHLAHSYAPKNSGALWIKAGVPAAAISHGAGQEHGKRPGTESVMMVVGLGAAADLANRHLTRIYQHLTAMRDRLHAAIQSQLALKLGQPMAEVVREYVRLNGHPVSRLPNTLSLGFRHCRAASLVAALAKCNVACSAGAACHSTPHAAAGSEACAAPEVFL
jgi:cysteine desulfurase